MNVAGERICKENIRGQKVKLKRQSHRIHQKSKGYMEKPWREEREEGNDIITF